MNRLTRWALAVLLLGGLLVAQAAAAEPLKVRYSIWVGYGPLFIAKEKGYFKEEKVDHFERNNVPESAPMAPEEGAPIAKFPKI